jgi:hypothetical protein
MVDKEVMFSPNTSICLPAATGVDVVTSSCLKIQGTLEGTPNRWRSGQRGVNFMLRVDGGNLVWVLGTLVEPDFDAQPGDILAVWGRWCATEAPHFIPDMIDKIMVSER